MCRKCVIKCLDDFMRLATEDFKTYGSLKLPLPDIEFCSADGFHEERRRSSGRVLHFPGRNYNQAKQCVVMLRVIYLVLENLRLHTNITTRDIYYQDVALFSNQQQVSSAIERLCLNIGVSRSVLGIVPSPKGLVVADLRVTLEDYDPDTRQTIRVQKTIHRFNGPSLVPVGSEIVDIRHLQGTTSPKYILIVEKEGVFSHIHSQLSEAILITGKGFPDHYTRKFLYALHKCNPDLPIYGLVDSDVHGMHILHTYENSGANTLEYHFPISTVEFLGVSILDFQDGWLDISTREYKLIMSMLKKDWIHDEKHAAWRREVQRQIFMGKKVEMNILDRHHLTNLVNYVRDRVNVMQKERTQREEDLKMLPLGETQTPPSTIDLDHKLIDPEILGCAEQKAMSAKACSKQSNRKGEPQRKVASCRKQGFSNAQDGSVPNQRRSLRSTLRPSSYAPAPGVY